MFLNACSFIHTLQLAAAASDMYDLQAKKNDERAERAAKIISLASLLLLFVAVALYAGLSIIGWNAYIAAVALFSAGLAGYPLLTLLTHAVASQTSRSFTRLGSYDRYRTDSSAAAFCP